MAVAKKKSEHAQAAPRKRMPKNAAPALNTIGAEPMDRSNPIHAFWNKLQLAFENRSPATDEKSARQENKAPAKKRKLSAHNIFI